MRVGVPRELKNHEYRVALTPAGVTELVRAGHTVLVERGAGEGSSIPDVEYIDVGARIVPAADDVWARIHASGRVEAYSAGSRPSGRVNPKAIESMREKGYDLTRHRSKGLADLPSGEFDVVVGMGCGDEGCAVVPARRRETWDIPDPKEMPPERFRSGALTWAAPSLAACINPGPPPVMMSQPIPARAADTRRTSS